MCTNSPRNSVEIFNWRDVLGEVLNIAREFVTYRQTRRDNGCTTTMEYRVPLRRYTTAEEWIDGKGGRTSGVRNSICTALSVAQSE